MPNDTDTTARRAEIELRLKKLERTINDYRSHIRDLSITVDALTTELEELAAIGTANARDALTS